MNRFRTFLFLLALIIFGTIPRLSGHASARADDPVQVIHLSASGFEQAHAVAFSTDGKFLAVGGTSGIYLFDPNKLSAIEFIRTNTWARSVAFIPSTHILAAGLFDDTIKFWSVPGAQLTRTIEDPNGRVRSISFTREGSLIASASDDDTIRIWRAEDASLLLVLDKNTTGVRAVALSPDGELVAGALGDKTVRIWNVSSGELVYTLRGHEDWVRCLAFSPNGQLLASGAFDKTIHLWNVSNGELKQILKGHSSSVLGVAFSPDGKTLASGSVDETVRLWNVSNGAPIRVLQGHTDFVYTVSFSPDGQTLASGSADNTVRLWNMNVLGTADPNTELPNVSTPFDCRVCHHRRGQVGPSRVIELNCENCHEGGISLSWCTGFPRSSSIKKTPILYNPASDVSGVPVNNRDLAVVIASPGNGETLYVRGRYMVPEFISGRIFLSDPRLIDKVVVHLDIISDGKTTASLVTHPTASGTFNFNVAINPESSPPQFSNPGTRQCLVCHREFVAEAGLPQGDVHVVVMAVTQDGQQAMDDRWIYVDPSHDASLPVQVLDDFTGKPLEGLSLEASTTIYQWRDRFAEGVSGGEGKAQLSVEALTQAHTDYNLSIPSQVLNGILYASPGPIEVTFDPDATSHSMVTLTAHALTGRINGELGGVGLTSVQNLKVWAIQLPAGPAYQTSLTSQNMFVFGQIPVSRYIVMPDPTALSKQGLHTAAQTINLLESPLSNISFSLENGRSIHGTVHTSDGNVMPFAWVNIGDAGLIHTIDATTGNFTISNFPSDVVFLTVSAPGYYAIPKSVKKSTETLDFQLVPRPETQFVKWGDGEIVLPPETKATADSPDLNLEYGWVWGQNTAAEPIKIHLPGLDIFLANGKFALENPAEGTGWLYLYRGQAEILYGDDPTPVKVGGGQMIAFLDGADPFPMESAVATALHPAIKELPVSETMEPSLGARLQNWLVKTGIGAMQTVTFITYILSLVTLTLIPLLVLFSYRRRRQNPVDFQEKK